MNAAGPSKDNVKAVVMDMSENWHEETLKSKFSLKNFGGNIYALKVLEIGL